MKKIWRNVLILIVVAVFVTLIVILLVRLTPAPPVREMEKARESISSAEKISAETYSRKLFNEAKVFYDSAMVNWKRENAKFLYFRDFERVRMFAGLAAKKAGEAAETSVTNTATLKQKTGQKIDSLNNLVRVLNTLFTNYPLSAETRSRISKGKMLLGEGSLNFKNGQYLQANRKINESEYLLTTSYDNATENLKNYFKSFSVWKKWVDRTIRESKKNKDYSIVIDKFSRKFIVYLNGAVKYEFEAELGKNWVGDKRVRGDNATPEGMYKITKKFDSRKTKYYKALLIDYPNAEDLARFKSEVARGSLPASARIGGLIEIHGNGGKGIDWTEGCVALTDSEMDIVFRIAAIGTPVTIVGSTVDLSHILKL